MLPVLQRLLTILLPLFTAFSSVRTMMLDVTCLTVMLIKLLFAGRNIVQTPRNRYECVDLKRKCHYIVDTSNAFVT